MSAVIKRVSRAVSMRVGETSSSPSPDDLLEVARLFSRSEDHEAAAVAFELAADTMKAAKVPDIEKIQRWRRAAFRERLNAKAGW